MLILILYAALSGLVTVLSPCVLPILPVVLSSTLTGGKRRPLGVIAGLIASFSIFTLAVSWIISLFGLSANVLRIGAVLIIGLLGAGLVVPALHTWIERGLSRLPGLVRQDRAPGSGFASGLLVGASLGLIWAPCAGPILAAVTTLAAAQKVTLGAGLVVAAYAVGAGIPLLAVAYGGRAAIARVPFLVRHPLHIQRAFGIVMILTALLIAFNVDVQVSAWAASLVPGSWTAQLDGFESSAVVTQNLSQLRQNLGGSGALPAPSTGIYAGGINAGSGRAAAPVQKALPDFGPAPELVGLTHWINSQPLTIHALRGKVVLIDFWTYSCINCIRTLPYVTGWYAKYKDQGLVVIGVHTPEFAFEHDAGNVEQAVKRFGITYPVALDNTDATWLAFNNQYWPAEYLIDANGHLRHTQFGEGSYDETEKAIQGLLAEAGHPVRETLMQATGVPFSPLETPETYIGTDQQGSYASPQPVFPGKASSYSFPLILPQDAFAVSGQWIFLGQ